MRRQTARPIGAAFAGALAAIATSLAISSEPWTLERAVEQALAANPAARIAESRIAAAAAAVELARSALQPNVFVGGGYLRTNHPAQAFGLILSQEAFDPGLNFNDVPSVDNLDVFGRVVLPLYRGGTSSATRRQALAHRSAAEQQEVAVRRALEFEVGRVFFTIEKTRAFSAAAEAAVEAFESSLEIARRRKAAGAALKSDVLDIEVRLARGQEDLVRARNANALARHALRNLLAIDAGEIDIVETEYTLEIPGDTVAPARAELAAAVQMRAAAAARLRGARGGTYPHVDAFGGLAHNRGWELDGSGSSYAAGLEVRWNVWDGKRTHAGIRDAQARLRIATEREREVRLAVDLEVTEARLKLAEADARLVVNRRATELAAESAALTRARFDQGLALTTQLVDAETALTGARTRRAEAESDRRIAIAALRRALGLPLLVGGAI